MTASAGPRGTSPVATKDAYQLEEEGGLVRLEGGLGVQMLCCCTVKVILGGDDGGSGEFLDELFNAVSVSHPLMARLGFFCCAFV